MVIDNESASLDKICDCFRVGTNQEILKIRILKRMINKVVKNFIQQSKSSYGVPIGMGKVGGDPFLTTSYVRGARRTGFEQGNDAAEESLRRKIDPATTSVSYHKFLRGNALF